MGEQSVAVGRLLGHIRVREALKCHQPLHPVWVELGIGDGRRAADGDADQGEDAEPQRVDELRYVAKQPQVLIARRSGRLPMSTQVQG